jgi:broad specificity phosphatase PhoE
MNFGVIEGLRHKEIMNSYADIYKQWLKDPYNNHIPKAEKLNLFKKRVTSVMKKIVSHNGCKTIALVCHGGTISIFIAGILKSRNFWRYIPGSASISILEYGKNGPKIKVFNEIAHLKVNRWEK